MSLSHFPASKFVGMDDDDLLELADLYIGAADRLRTYVEARRLARESLENLAEASYLPEVA